MKVNARKTETITVLALRVEIDKLLRRDPERPLHIHYSVPDIPLAKPSLEAGTETGHILDCQPGPQPGTALDLVGSFEIRVGSLPVKPGQDRKSTRLNSSHQI